MELIITDGYGICPVCNGTKRIPAGDDQYKAITSGYDAETDTHKCRNCGGQRMYGNSSGVVRRRKDNNEPCVHEYNYTKLGNCYHNCTCKHCGDSYNIDSGD